VGLKGPPQGISVDIDAVTGAVQQIRCLVNGLSFIPPASITALSIAIVMHASHYLYSILFRLP
jgi:hypothetical protein